MLVKNRPALGETPWGVTASEFSELRLTIRKSPFSGVELVKTLILYSKLLSTPTPYFAWIRLKDTKILMNSNLWTPLETPPICRWCPLTLTPYDFSLRRDDYTTLNFCRVTIFYSSITDTNQLDLTQVTVNPRWDVYFTSSQNVLTFKDNSRIKPSNNISNLRETPTSCAYRVIHDKLHWRRITPPPTRCRTWSSRSTWRFST